MNCRQIQELLPLYVARDLEEKRTLRVRAHLQSCAECAGSADEYGATRQLLQQFAPPPFSEEVYRGIRQRVLRDIGRESTAPGLSRLLESLFRPRLRWAVATALLLAVCVSAVYFIANQSNDRRDRQQVADNGRTVAGPTSDSSNESDGFPSTTTVKNKGPVQGLAGGPRQPQRQRTAGAADRTKPATVNGSDPRSMSAQTLPPNNNLAEPDTVPSREPATSEKTLRLEMQTRDPNIRIIWFTPQATKQDSPGKFSKGT